MKLDYTKFFTLLTAALAVVYYIGTTVDESETIYWLVPSEYVLYSIIISIIITLYCYTRRL